MGLASALDWVSSCFLAEHLQLGRVTSINTNWMNILKAIIGEVGGDEAGSAWTMPDAGKAFWNRAVLGRRRELGSAIVTHAER